MKTFSDSSQLTIKVGRLILEHYGLIACDRTTLDNGQCTELWLITDYHERGSLFDWLNLKTVSIQDRVTKRLEIFCDVQRFYFFLILRQEAVLMMFTTIAGLEHLHKEFHGTKGKWSIAHRDVKSKNILLKSSGECVIGPGSTSVMSVIPR